MQNWTEEEKILSQMRTWSQALRALSFGEIFIGGTHEGLKEINKKPPPTTTETRLLMA